jgi:hypothetical protein
MVLIPCTGHYYQRFVQNICIRSVEYILANSGQSAILFLSQAHRRTGMTATASSRRHQRAKAMNALMEKYLSEPGITRRAFCARHQIAYSTFHYYLAKRRR